MLLMMTVAAMRFRDRRAFKEALRKQLPRGTVGEARLGDQGEECSTCDEGTPRITAAAAKYARRRFPNLAKKASPGTYHGTYDADDAGEEVPSVSGVAGPPTKKAKSVEGKSTAAKSTHVKKTYVTHPKNVHSDWVIQFLACLH